MQTKRGRAEKTRHEKSRPKAAFGGGKAHGRLRGRKCAGARGGTRTPTPLQASGPKPGASTNFATRAGVKGRGFYAGGGRVRSGSGG